MKTDDRQMKKVLQTMVNYNRLSGWVGIWSGKYYFLDGEAHDADTCFSISFDTMDELKSHLASYDQLAVPVEIVGLPGGYFKTSSISELRDTLEAYGMSIHGWFTREQVYAHAPAFVAEVNGWDYQIGAPNIAGLCGPMKGHDFKTDTLVVRYETWKAYDQLSR